MSEKERNPDEVLVEKHAAELSEHFDSVQIFVTRNQADITRSVDHGEGNWYARYRQVIDWIRCENERRRLEIIKEEDES